MPPSVIEQHELECPPWAAAKTPMMNTCELPHGLTLRSGRSTEGEIAKCNREGGRTRQGQEGAGHRADLLRKKL